MADMMYTLMESVGQPLVAMMPTLITLVGVPFIAHKVIDRLIRIPRVGNYSDRYILVTGCDSGFGNLTAKRLDKLGCHVFAGCFTDKGKEELRMASTERVRTFSLDVTKKESVQDALRFVMGKLPEGRGLWGLLNNAGMLACNGNPEWFTADDYRKQCDVNLFGLIDVAVTFLPLVKKEKGRVINVSSVTGRYASTMMTPYSVSKYGVEAFTDGLRRSIYVFGCKAILIEPGLFKTGLASEELFHKICQTSWNNAPLNVKEDYGMEYASRVEQKQMAAYLKYASTSLSDVVDAYEHALFGSVPRARYIVGKEVQYFIVPLQALPEWLGDFIMRVVIFTRPQPAALKK